MTITDSKPQADQSVDANEDRAQDGRDTAPRDVEGGSTTVAIANQTER